MKSNKIPMCLIIMLGLGFKLAIVPTKALPHHLRHEHHRERAHHNHNKSNSSTSLKITDSVSTDSTAPESVPTPSINISGESSVKNSKSSESFVPVTTSEFLEKMVNEKQVSGEPEFRPSFNPDEPPVVPRRTFKNIPSFLNLFHNLLVNTKPNDENSAEIPSDRERAGMKKTKTIQTLTRAWFPKSFTFGEMGNFIVSFSTKSTQRDQLQDFIGAQIIFTLRDGGKNYAEENAAIKFVSYSHSNGNLTLATSTPLPISNQNKYYSFDVTDEILSGLNMNSSDLGIEAEETTFAFRIQKSFKPTQSHISFPDYFDTDVDKPFILIRYQNFPFVVPQTISDGKQNSFPSQSSGSKVYRRKRTAALRNTSVRNASNLDTSSKKNTSKSSENNNEAELNEATTPIFNSGSTRSSSVELVPTKHQYTTPSNAERDDDNVINVFNGLSTNTIEENTRGTKAHVNNATESTYGLTTNKNGPLVDQIKTNSKRTEGVNPTLSPVQPRINSRLCRREKLLVSPEAIGWNHVISPQVLDLGYCAGLCPYPLVNDRFNFSTHSFIIDRLRLMQPLSDLPLNFPSPCCVPVSYGSSMLMTDDGNGGIATDSYRDISVSSCGCR